MTIFETKFDEQIGDTNEQINVKLEYGEDFTGDGKNDVKVTLSLDAGSNSATEDMIGIAFDIQHNATAGLSIVDITTATGNGTVSTHSPSYVIGADQVSDGLLDPGFSTSGGGSDEPYDVGIQFSEGGSGEGIVQTASFVMTTPGADLDAEALLENTDWWVRLQSTDGGEGSAKMGGLILDLPPVGHDEQSEPGSAMTPGFWKNHPDIFHQETGSNLSDSWETLFGVDVLSAVKTGPKSSTQDPTLGEALGAPGGDEAALLRAATSGWANASSDDLNYSYNDEATLREGVAAAYGIDPANYPDTASYEAALDGALEDVGAQMQLVDTNTDDRIDADEVIEAVKDAYAPGGSLEPTDFGDLAKAFDAMNNMPHIDASEFLA